MERARCQLGIELPVGLRCARSRRWVTAWKRRNGQCAAVLILIRPENVPSVKLALKLGARAEGHAQLAGFDHIVFSVSK